MGQAQLELFEQETVVLAYDEDDPPPKETYSDMHWWFINRYAEWCAGWLRSIGLY